MRVNPRIRKFFGGLIAMAVIIMAVVMVIKNPAPEHIEDTNGADNCALQQITEEDVAALQMGSRGWLGEKEKKLNLGIVSFSDGVEYSCKKFSGVRVMYTCTVFKGSDVELYLTDFKVRGGNFAFYVLFEGEVVGQVVPDEFGYAEFLLENVDKTGTLEYVIAGESADFEFTATERW